MTKIETIESISDHLAATSIDVVPKRCTYIRNWNSRCKACLTACQHDAIERSLGRLSINSEKCTECGACVAACPVSTMRTTAPGQNEIVRQARQSAQLNAGSAAFICERQARAIGVDAQRVVVLPCLNYLDEYLISGLFAFKLKRVILFTCGCQDCTIDCEQPYLDQMIQSTKSVLAYWDVKGTFATLDEVPDTLRISQSKVKGATIRSDKREAFKQSGASAAEFAWKAMRKTIGSITGEELQEDDPNERIIVKPEERFPADSYRSVRLLNMLDHIGTRPRGATIDTRFWASVDIDPNCCRYCGTCAMMCSTQALKYELDASKRATLTFQPSLCTNCRLCKDACLTHSLIYSNKIPANELDRDVVKDLFRDHELPTSKKSFVS